MPAAAANDNPGRAPVRVFEGRFATMPRQVVFIASAPHSGSTLLEYLLAEDERTVAVGEVFQLVNPRSRLRHRLTGERCGCGEPVTNCLFWRPALEALEALDGASAVERYGAVLEAFGDPLGGERVVIDSSKTLPALEALAGTPEVELRVIHLVRDVRGWLVSALASFERNPPRHLLHRGWKRWALRAARPIRTSRFFNCLWWYWSNRRIARFLETAPIASQRISYEALCRDTARVVGALSAHTGLAAGDRPTSDRARLHSIFGNRMRFDPDKRREIRYDDRWQREQSWVAPLRLLPFVTAYSRELARDPASCASD